MSTAYNPFSISKAYSTQQKSAKHQSNRWQKFSLIFCKFVGSCCLWLGITSNVQAEIFKDITINTAKSTHEYQLDNGLKLIVREDHRTPMIVTQVWYKVGGSYEPDGITGISHMLEHMMFRGTPKYPQGEFSRLIAVNGGHQNAFTGQDFTAYYQEIDPERLDLCLELEADRMSNLSLSSEDFDQEIKVVIEERRLRTEDQPNALAIERLFAAAHVSNPYHQPNVGWMNDLEHMTIDDVRKWYKTWYGPDNATVVIVGDVQADQVYDLVKKHFSSLKPIHPPTLKPRKEIKPLGTRQLEIRQPITVPNIYLTYNVPNLHSAEDPKEAYALLVLLLGLDGGNSARFPRHLVREQGIATHLSSWYNPFQLHETLFLISATPTDPSNIAGLESAILSQLAEIKTTPLSDAELKRIKTNAIAENIYNKDSLSEQALEIGVLESIGLSWKVGLDFPKHIEAITAEQVQAVAQKYLTPERLTIAKLLPALGDK